MRFKTHSFKMEREEPDTPVMDVMALGHRRGLEMRLPVREVYIDHYERNILSVELQKMGQEFVEGMLLYGMIVHTE